MPLELLLCCCWFDCAVDVGLAVGGGFGVSDGEGMGGAVGRFEGAGVGDFGDVPGAELVGGEG